MKLSLIRRLLQTTPPGQYPDLAHDPDAQKAMQELDKSRQELLFVEARFAAGKKNEKPFPEADDLSAIQNWAREEETATRAARSALRARQRVGRAQATKARPRR